MKTKNFIGLVASFFALSILITSCNKEDSLILNNDLQNIEDDALLEATDEDIFNLADQYDAAVGEPGLKSGTLFTEGCPVVTHVVSGDTLIITIDFGVSCGDSLTNIRSGKIIIHRYGRYRLEGFFRSIMLENFYINGNHIEGTRTVSNMGAGTNGNLVFMVKLENGKLTTEAGEVLERSYERNREWVAGSATPGVFDDEYMVTGSGTGKNFEGMSCTRTIMEALHIKNACRFIVSGVIESVIGDEEPIVLDYGDGECDNKATLSKGTESKEIELSMKRHRWAKRKLQ